MANVTYLARDGEVQVHWEVSSKPFNSILLLGIVAITSDSKVRAQMWALPVFCWSKSLQWLSAISEDFIN